MFKKFLFPDYRYSDRISWYILLARVIFAIMLFTHGLYKIENFEMLKTTFPDPIGIGVEVSLVLVIIAETLCCLAVVLGFLWRLSIIPIILTMLVAVFVLMAGKGFSDRELPALYLLIFILLYFVGPGDYSIDKLISKRLRKR